MEERPRVGRLDQDRRVKRAVADAEDSRRRGASSEAAIGRVRLRRLNQVRRLVGELLDVRVEVCVLSGEEEVARAGVQVAEEALARPFIRRVRVEHVSRIEEYRLASLWHGAFQL